MMRRSWWRMLLMVAALAMPGLALAFGAEANNTVVLPKGETKTGTYYVAGRSITINGDVNGDLFCAGSTIAVNGAVHGDVICAGQSITINGPVDGSVRLAGQSLIVAGTVGRNVTVAGQSFELGTGARVAGDVGAWGQNVSLNGPVDKDVYGAVDSLSIDNKVGSVSAQLTSLNLGTDAAVQGDLNYTSDQPLTVDSSKVTGTVKHTAPSHPQRERHQRTFQSWLAGLVFWLAALLAVGLVLVALAPGLVRRVGQVLRTRPGASIGWGVVVMLLGPIVFVMLLLTAIGIPLAFLEVVVWGVAMALSTVFAGVGVGQWLLGRFQWNASSLWWATAVGIVVTTLVFQVPVLGPLAVLVAMWWGLGALMLSTKALRA